MKSTSNELRLSIKHLLHLTCLAHGCYNVACQIRSEYKLAVDLIMDVKTLLVKASKRRKILETNCPTLKFPPAPVVTRWGTMIKSAPYYADKENRKEVIKGITSINAAEKKPKKKKKGSKTKRKSKRKAKAKTKESDKDNEEVEEEDKKDETKEDEELDETANEKTKCEQILFSLTNAETIAEIEMISQNYQIIVENIKKLEKLNLPARAAIKYIDAIGNQLKSTPNVPESITEKYDDVFAKNIGYVALRKYLIDGEVTDVLTYWSEEDLPVLHKAPIVSTEIERDFSIYKIMLRSNRRKFDFYNFKKFVVSKCILHRVFMFFIMKISYKQFKTVSFFKLNFL